MTHRVADADIGDYCATVLLNPQTYARTPLVYPPGHGLLSQQEIADIVSEETGREVRYQAVSAEEWGRQIDAAFGGLRQE